MISLLVLGSVGLLVILFVSDIVYVEYTRIMDQKSICDTGCVHHGDEEWELSVEMGQGVPAQIQRRSNLSFEQWIDEFHIYGRPVIVTDATIGWPLFQKATDVWIEEQWGGEREHQTEFINVDSDRGKVTNEKYKNPLKKKFAFARRKRQENGVENRTHWHKDSPHVGWGDEFDFTNSYLFLDQLPTNPLNGSYKVPYFLPQPSHIEHHRAVAYYGGPGMGLSRHQDFHSCMVAWQAQIAGKKQWYLQSPLRSRHLESFPEAAFEDIIHQKEGTSTGLDDKVNKTLVYEFDIYPGEVLVWNVQYYHNSSTTERSFSLTFHLMCADIRQHARKVGLPHLMNKRNFFWEAFYNHVKCKSNFVELYQYCCEEWFGKKGTFRQFLGSFAL